MTDPGEPLVTPDDLRRLESAIADLTATVEQLRKDSQVQFTRMSQMQASLDLIRTAWSAVGADPQPRLYKGPERRAKPR